MDQPETEAVMLLLGANTNWPERGRAMVKLARAWNRLIVWTANPRYPCVVEEFHGKMIFYVLHPPAEGRGREREYGLPWAPDNVPSEFWEGQREVFSSYYARENEGNIPDLGDLGARLRTWL